MDYWRALVNTALKLWVAYVMELVISQNYLTQNNFGNKINFKEYITVFLFMTLCRVFWVEKRAV